ncbi:hypothetical protein IQ241_21950 [Romeria aff. gracilis LEGE 07310]|uniref:Uncharacterized protein n=1 Tax=Vasconcelosia minhoensis LEGE 07310 TaxID=915328 RepID=A0A8J7AJ53_9CYAN|nr:hypothetical protein [Romeria gracilis]MBE9079919.1 hypothetical protein [Romeria aff. gracilis LEGE 07310]
MVQPRVQLQQAKTDAARLQRLADAGAISEQAAEQAQFAKAVPEQALRSAEEQIHTRQQAGSAARGQVESQRVVIAQERQIEAQLMISYDCGRRLPDWV